MADKTTAEKWRELSEEVIVGMQDWRVQHPKATMREIERTLDERLAGLRARMLQDTALASATRVWEEGSEDACCPTCGRALKPRGVQRRQLQTQGGQEVVLEREYGECPGCGAGLFPPG
jgi:YgiT-type zinc finger domain-containing protein